MLLPEPGPQATPLPDCVPRTFTRIPMPHDAPHTPTDKTNPPLHTDSEEWLRLTPPRHTQPLYVPFVCVTNWRLRQTWGRHYNWHPSPVHCTLFSVPVLQRGCLLPDRGGKYRRYPFLPRFRSMPGGPPMGPIPRNVSPRWQGNRFPQANESSETCCTGVVVGMRGRRP